MNYLWPIVTGITVVDVWTLPHLGFWIVVGSTLRPLKVNCWVAYIGCFAASLIWEVFEIFAFKQWPGLWEDPESWVTSWIGAPLPVVGVPAIWYLLEHRRRREQ